MIKGCVFFDYDGTLVDERDQIYVPTKGTKQAIKQLQDQGYVCLLATGRAKSYLPQGALDLHLDGYVTCNGAYVEVNGVALFHQPFHQDVIKKTLDVLNAHDLNYILEGQKKCYVKDMKDLQFQHFMHYFHIPYDHYDLIRDIDEAVLGTSKMTVISQNKGQMEEIANKLRPYFACSFHRNCMTFDISDKNINKSNGIKALMEHYQLPRSAMYAFGDGDNDIEMLAYAGCGIAMTPYHPALMEVADHITCSVKEDGIYKALCALHVLSN